MRWLTLLLSFIFIWNGCTTSQVSPSSHSRQSIDSIYQIQIALLQPKMDSTCASLHQVFFKTSVDSILAVRQLEMDYLVK